MQIRNNVRERRREKIARLIEGQSAERRPAGPPDEAGGEADARPRDVSWSTVRNETRASPEFDRPRSDSGQERFRPEASPSDPDPELWWRERERRMKTGQVPGWQGLKGLPPTSAPAGGGSSAGRDPGRFLRGVGTRIAIASIALAGFWGWTRLELPGSSEARMWLAEAVTQDMDFRAIEAWYGETFGGSPSFLPFGRDEPDTREVTALLDPADTTVPIRGTVAETFAANGTGMQVAAAAGSEVFAIYTGKVQQVAQDPAGGVTILVQHPNHVLSVYGGLAESDVQPNDWVETGQTLGRLGSAANGEAKLYFAVQQNGTVLDPAEVVAFD
ncbi:peptidoglycan DD-metalloendopeptidase family protein [Cohnella hongkongensis]|uniref:Peptidoglycan DD-metalloendopeptidase family protein n=1 Tax=Cohnella hongkongensis TaxID=178337 RepID=A0ABV9FEP5_9BACL